MCGFVGILEFSSPSRISPELLRKMNDSLRHRGPDDQGYVMADPDASDGVLRFRENPPSSPHSAMAHIRLGLAHQRLSILDLRPQAAQPMSNQAKDLWIVYNGEIFNYIEIRNELIRQGETFQTHSDTEVILKAYQRWGEDCLSHFNGMWAFLLWDRRQKLLFCARDRFGIKPFYYYSDPKRFVAASEIKALLVHPDVPKRPHDDAVYDYLLFGLQDHSETTFFEGIHQISPACSLTLDIPTGKFRIKRWWDITLPCRTSDRRHPDETEAQTQFYSLLRDSVRLRLRSDVPLGICISGGLDSSSVAHLIDEGARKNLKGFSACFEDPHCDDRPFIEEVTKSLSLESHYTFPEATDLWDELETMTWAMDEPFRSSNQFSQWCVMKLIHKHGIRVALSGQGSDEFLGGYRGYLSVFIASLLREGRFFHAIRELKLAPTAHQGMNKGLLAARVLYGFLPSFVTRWVGIGETIAGHTLRSQSLQFVSPPFLRRFRIRHSHYWKERHPDWTHLTRKLYQDVFRYSLPALLHYEDRNGMAFSIETRHPFLDHRLVEYVFSLPNSFKIRDGESKWLLRQAMRGTLPEKIQNRRDKKGFITPEAEWMRIGEPRIKRYFSGPRVALSSYVNPKRILENFYSVLQRDSYNRHTELWRPVNLEVWLRKFF